MSAQPEACLAQLQLHQAAALLPQWESTKKSGGIMPLPALVCLVTAQVESQDTRFGRCLPTLH